MNEKQFDEKRFDWSTVRPITEEDWRRLSQWMEPPPEKVIGWAQYVQRGPVMATNLSEKELERRILQVLSDIENTMVIQLASRNLSRDEIDVLWKLRKRIQDTRKEYDTQCDIQRERSWRNGPDPQSD